MNPLLPIFQNKIIQDIFQRVLYVWAVRHPGTGYVQGINDLLTPFFVVFLTEYTETGNFFISWCPIKLDNHDNKSDFFKQNDCLK